MSVSNFEELKAHIGHKIVVVGYHSEPWDRPYYACPINASIECEDCNEVLLSFDYDEEAEEAEYSSSGSPLNLPDKKD